MNQKYLDRIRPTPCNCGGAWILVNTYINDAAYEWDRTNEKKHCFQCDVCFAETSTIERHKP